MFFFFQAEDVIRDFCLSRGLGDWYKRQRLRLSLVDQHKINEEQLKSLGAKGIVKIGNDGLQVVLGPEAELVAEAMKQKVK